MVEENKNTSENKLPLVVKVKSTLLINFNEKVVKELDEYTGKEKDTYSYCQVFIDFKGKLSRDFIIEELIKAKYPTYGSELAAINSGVEERVSEHREWRQLCKTVADEVIQELFGG